jgi:peptide-methionine (S)-S-oxide reductase
MREPGVVGTKVGVSSVWVLAVFLKRCLEEHTIEKYLNLYLIISTILFKIHLPSQVGYTQGDKENPTYQEVCTGTTGHTEAMLVKYDPDVVSFERLVHLAMDRLGENKYFKNQVGNDVGTQYRHGVYYHTDQQKEVATKIVMAHEGCVTEVLPAVKFWEAEEYHQQYLLKGGQSARKEDKSVIRCYG